MSTVFNPSNGQRLSLWEWAVVLALAIAACVVIPKLDPRGDQDPQGRRIPKSLNEDYWYFERMCERAVAANDGVMLGDSVVWGAYVSAEASLPAQLSRERRVANLGLHGAHPAALEGLVRAFGASIHDTAVIVHCNLLWMSSERLDLQGSRPFEFNHQELVDQRPGVIGSYRATLDQRLGVVMRRLLPPLAFSRHLQKASFEDLAIPAWTLESPYQDPLPALGRALDSAREPSESPRKRFPGLQPAKKQSYPFVDLDSSYQRERFLSLIQLLRGRRNRVAVIIGPFNVHVIDDESRDLYRARVTQFARELRDQGVAVLVPKALDPELYADATHPLAEGYQRIAEEFRAGDLPKTLWP